MGITPAYIAYCKLPSTNTFTDTQHSASIYVSDHADLR